MGVGGVLAQCCVALLRVLSCCPTCTTRHRITAATRTTRSCCRCWRAAVNLTLGQFLQSGRYVLKTNDLNLKSGLYHVQNSLSRLSVLVSPTPCSLLRFVSDWVYSGVFRDVYREFMIQVNEDYLGCRGEITHRHTLAHACTGCHVNPLAQSARCENEAPARGTEKIDFITAFIA